MTEMHSIGVLAKLAGVHVETIRYYERIGLLHQPRRPYGKIRRYDDGQLNRLKFIRRVQSAGFALADVAALLRLSEHPSCRATRKLTMDKLRTVEARIAELTSVRRELRTWIARCDANDDEASCPTLNAIEDPIIL